MSHSVAGIFSFDTNETKYNNYKVKQYESQGKRDNSQTVYPLPLSRA
jgi:hypothetical protein